MMGLDAIFTRLFAIAGQGGDRFSLDTPPEQEAAAQLLQGYSPRGRVEEGLLQKALALLRRPSGGRFQINSALFRCPSGQPDCQGLLIPLPPYTAIGFFVFTGALRKDLIHWVGLAPRRWEEIIQPLQQPSKNAEEERRRLQTVVEKFEKKVNPEDDIGGQLGNLVAIFAPAEDQQDCFDKMHGVMQLLSALDAAGLLRYHSFDRLHPNALIGFNEHTAAVLKEKGSRTEYVVDSWNYNVYIWSKEFWTDYFKDQFRRPTP